MAAALPGRSQQAASVCGPVGPAGPLQSPKSQGATAGGVRGKTKLVCVAAGGHWPVLSSVWKPEAAVTPSGGEVAPGAASAS